MADSELHRAPAPQTGPPLVYRGEARIQALWRPRQQIKHSSGGPWHHTYHITGIGAPESPAGDTDPDQGTPRPKDYPPRLPYSSPAHHCEGLRLTWAHRAGWAGAIMRAHGRPRRGAEQT